MRKRGEGRNRRTRRSPTPSSPSSGCSRLQALLISTPPFLLNYEHATESHSGLRGSMDAGHCFTHPHFPPAMSLDSMTGPSKDPHDGKEEASRHHRSLKRGAEQQQVIVRSGLRCAAEDESTQWYFAEEREGAARAVVKPEGFPEPRGRDAHPMSSSAAVDRSSGSWNCLAQ
ncbi:hypothetical protein BHE74_00011240 [Ensete ventricosum]|uniref:Uncharacterized protein n=1 Tax=Ensete ventricosum TaxID=4639 RepID=A0A444FAP9_ENSVE|nr:hypothetical protein GW17_00016195 [Ensete ventricosum]RWW80416.1 hypothetical protein BHE74_00011240 [Ensete ventricosum]RZR72071.1 hypothetical protein BHM03_00010229 [Ensete ventricosum]